MRRILFAALLLTGSVAAFTRCAKAGFTCPDAFTVDGGACSKCDPNRSDSCQPGLVCCLPCRGTPFPPDEYYGTCSNQCTEQICP